jgi:hypothetical protein
VRSITLMARNGQLDAFMEHLNSVTWHNPIGSGRVYGMALIEARPFADHIYLQLIRSLEQGKGHGSKALHLLCTFADHYRVAIQCAAVKIGKDGLTAAELRRWYKRYGFVDSGQGYMRREPDSTPQPAPMRCRPSAQ